MRNKILEVMNLLVEFKTIDGIAKVVNNIDLSVQEGEVVGLVGESGCGKSVTAKTILNSLPIPPGKIADGKINLYGENLVELNKKERKKIINIELSYIPQDPMTSLNPVFTIGEQMRDLIKWQQKEKASICGILGISKGIGASEVRALELLKSVHLPSPREILKRYPIELSGGMRQRVLIAMSLIKRPSLLLADEPTTALDVTVQKEILNLLEEKVRDEKLTVLYITHDLGVAKRLCDRIYVMYSGNIVETALTSELLRNPLHPYSQGLLNSIPKLTKKEIKGIDGRIPDNINPPSGCRFHPRCFMAKEVCRLYKPAPLEINHTHLIACHLYNEVKNHEK